MLIKSFFYYLITANVLVVLVTRTWWILSFGGNENYLLYVAISFSPKLYLMCSRFCLVWTLLLCIWKTDGFA